MADTQYALFSYSVLDELGIRASMTIPAMIDPTTGTPAAIKTEWLALGAEIDALTGAQITGGSVATVFTPDSGWKATPAAGSRVEQTGLFNFSNSTSKYKFGVDLPAIDNSKLDGNKIDLTDSDVTAFIGSLVGTFTGGRFANTATFALVALVDAILSFRKRRKQLSRASFEPGL